VNEAPRPDYVTDVTYVRCFENDLSPARLRLAAALNGFAPPPEADFDYCELGSAHGDTTAALAAAYPRAHFVGVDINPDHIASANKLAACGPLDNIRFLDADFEDLDKASLPDFDFITAHGVLSWIAPSKRKALLDLAQAKLKPGGILHVSYNALPGWAAVEPLRQLIAGRAAITEGNSLARAKSGVDLARAMSDLGAGYFAKNPGAREMLAKMDRLGLAYVAHEYLHAHWVPMYFAQVASEMAAHDLYFVGQVPLYLNYKDLAIPAQLLPMFTGLDDRVAFESLKDFAINEYFRRDVYMKGRHARADSHAHAYFDTTRFGGPLAGGEVPREARLPHHTLRYAGEIFDVLLPLLDEGAATVPALMEHPELRRFGLPRVRDAVMRLALGEAVVPMLDATKKVGAPPEGRYRLPLPWNRAVVREGLESETPVTLATTAAGTGLELSSVDAVAVFLVTEVAPDERRAWLANRCGRETFQLRVEGKVVQGKEERVRILSEEIGRFLATRLPKLVELGVLAVR
jgi:SAM-dependent methyltransferase